MKLKERILVLEKALRKIARGGTWCRSEGVTYMLPDDMGRVARKALKTTKTKAK